MQHQLIKGVCLTIVLAWQGMVAAESVQVNQAGLTLNAHMVKSEGAWNEGKVVLMTHGTLAHGRMEIIDSLQTALKDQGVTSLALTLSLGVSDRSGMYDCATPHTHRHQDALNEIDSWVEWLKQQGVTEVVLLGHSRGGNQTAWYAAERDQPLIKGSVLVAPMMWSAEYAASSYQTSYGKPLAPLLAQAQALVDAGTPQTLIDTIDFIYCKGSSATAAAVVSYYADDHHRHTPSLLPLLSKPVLVVVGSEDQVVKGLGDKVAPLVDGSQIQLVTIDGADHGFRDLYAEEIVELMVEFMQGL